MAVWPHPNGYVCPWVEGRIELGQGLDGPTWSQAEWTADFVDIQGHDLPRPKHRTRAKMIWCGEGLAIGAELEEPQIWATQTEHDSVIFHENDFEIFLDPDGDRHDYVEYEVNALGTDWDLFLAKPYRDGGCADSGYEIEGLRKHVACEGTPNDPSQVDRHWTVEVVIPWTALRVCGVDSLPRAGSHWRINFSRVQWELDVVDGRLTKREGVAEANWVWSPQWAIDMHRPELWGVVQFGATGDTFRPDPDWEAKCALMELYWAQEIWRQQTGAYAPSLEVLGMTELGLEMSANSEKWSARGNGWTLEGGSRLRRAQPLGTP